MPDDFHYFSTKEYELKTKFQISRDKFLKTLLKPLIFLGITPNFITLISFLCVLISAYFLIKKPYIALVFLFLHVIFDGIDGSLSRLANKSSRAGSFLDILNDHTGFVIITGTLIFYGYLNAILGIAYIYLYSLLVVLLIYCNALGIAPIFTVRTKYFLYIVYAIWVFFGLNFFQPAVIIFTAITLPLVAGVFIRVLSYLNKKS
jgi:phosphatidylglycerophosphate synthase